VLTAEISALLNTFGHCSTTFIACFLPPMASINSAISQAPWLSSRERRPPAGSDFFQTQFSVRPNRSNPKRHI
jgi:hypothetical protein